MLVIMKSFGALLYGLVAVPVLLLLKPRWSLFAALLVTIGFLGYPFLRTTTVFPDQAVIDIARDFAGEDRAGSAEFRFVNENALLKRARERLIFGWGGFCRACVFDEVYGDELSVRDGSWIITLGDRGVFGFTYRFGLLILPLWFAWRRRKRIPDGPPLVLFAGLALILAICLLDQLPNGAFNYMPYLYAGALFSLSNGMARRTPRMVRMERRVERQAERRDSRVSMSLPANASGGRLIDD
jgi:hypothetical protein